MTKSPKQVDSYEVSISFQWFLGIKTRKSVIKAERWSNSEMIQLRVDWGMFISNAGRNEGQTTLMSQKQGWRQVYKSKSWECVLIRFEEMYTCKKQTNKQRHNLCSSYEWLCSFGGSARSLGRSCEVWICPTSSKGWRQDGWLQINTNLIFQKY